MRVVIATTHQPFVGGGDRKIIRDLYQVLRARGLDVEVVDLPFQTDWRTVPEQTVGIRLLDLTGACGARVDRLIAVRYPSYALRHPNKVCWFLHHHREAYDLWNTPWGSMPDTATGRHYRDLMRRSDDRYLRECVRVYGNSRTMVGRLRDYNGIEAGLLYPPLPPDHPFRPGPYGDYFLIVSRVNLIKRQELAVRAMKYTRPDRRLVVAGASDDPAYLPLLRQLAVDEGVADRVEFRGQVSEAEKAELMAHSRAVLYLPYQEDSYGYVSLEAMHSARPVVTLTDSGGPLELIADGLNGRVVAPDPAALGGVLDELWDDDDQVRRLGGEALATIDAHDIRWERVLEGLTT